jgi:mannose-1-phosphate guanylyltransferase/phosphomannomutase
MVKAMVMAAGAGTRLRPLTFAVPKPMVPVANRPVLEYTIENLRRHGITDLILNLHSHPQAIRNYFQDGERWGVHIEYSHEPELMGTAGGVKKVASFLKGGTFLVLSGDGLCDIDLTALLEFHRSKKADATIALTSVDTRFEYGVTLTDPRGRVQRFVEKPHWSEVFSSQVNTGIYVFEPSVLSEIPANTVYDFGNELWPKLLKKKARIFGQLSKDYWCDVGNINEYRRAQNDMLDGKIHFPFPGRPLRPRVWVDEGTEIDRSVVLEAPCLIGKHCEIGKNSNIGAYTVIGNNARIGRGVRLKNCILWDNVRVDDHVVLENCVIGHRARVTENISVYEGAVINVTG